MNDVFGIEDAGDGAGAMRKCRVQRPRLVLRPAGVDDHFHQVGMAVGDGLRDLTGRLVVGSYDDEHLEGGVITADQSRECRREDRFLVAGGNDQREGVGRIELDALHSPLRRSLRGAPSVHHPDQGGGCHSTEEKGGSYIEEVEEEAALDPQRFGGGRGRQQQQQQQADEDWRCEPSARASQPSHRPGRRRPQ
jgi:hypothetical protein